jgi:hypothetical protein
MLGCRLSRRCKSTSSLRVSIKLNHPSQTCFNILYSPPFSNMFRCSPPSFPACSLNQDMAVPSCIFEKWHTGLDAQGTNTPCHTRLSAVLRGQASGEKFFQTKHRQMKVAEKNRRFALEADEFELEIVLVAIHLDDFDGHGCGMEVRLVDLPKAAIAQLLHQRRLQLCPVNLRRNSHSYSQCLEALQLVPIITAFGHIHLPVSNWTVGL